MIPTLSADSEPAFFLLNNFAGPKLKPKALALFITKVFSICIYRLYNLMISRALKSFVLLKINQASFSDLLCSFVCLNHTDLSNVSFSPFYRVIIGVKYPGYLSFLWPTSPASYIPVFCIQGNPTLLTIFQVCYRGKTKRYFWADQ